MMKTIDCKTWKDAKAAIGRIRRKHEYCHDDRRQWKNEILYRGHSDANSELLTTLDRESGIGWALWGYLGIAADCMPQIQSIYPRQWSAVDRNEIDRFCKQERLGFEPPPMLAFLIYLRHHGFPSLLLDWTLSPWIAAHFAASATAIHSKRMAIFVYCNLSKRPEFEVVGKPNIHAIHSNLPTHPRHFLQQARYTYCTRFDRDEKFHVICKHLDAIPSDRDKEARLYKITFPAEERLVVLRELHESNINDFTLFQSEEGLVKSMAIRELDLEFEYPVPNASRTTSD